AVGGTHGRHLDVEVLGLRRHRAGGHQQTAGQRGECHRDHQRASWRWFPQMMAVPLLGSRRTAMSLPASRSMSASLLNRIGRSAVATARGARTVADGADATCVATWVASSVDGPLSHTKTLAASPMTPPHR